tara:strand:- start:10872 stop:12497 length:1626 start_codon:yes stop_codon:yes gene_type:complete
MPLETKHKKFIASLILFLISFFSVTEGIPDVGITWDEPFVYFTGSRLALMWTKEITTELKKGNFSALFDKKRLNRYWPPSTRETQARLHPNDHPPLARWLSAITWIVFHEIAGDLWSFRYSSAILLSILTTTIFITLSTRINFIAGFFSACALALMPRVFGHAHLSTTDFPMMSFWYFSVVSFYKGLYSKWWAWGFGLVLGLALSIKFTGFMIPLALGIYSITTKDKRALNNLIPSLTLTPFIFLALNPTFWTNTLSRFYHNFILLFLTRNEYAAFPTHYLGQTYVFDLPWHHSFVLTAATIPVQILILALLGLSGQIRFLFKPGWWSLLVWQLVFFYAILTLPFTPNHDGVRLFLSVFPFLACFAGLGFNSVSKAISDRIQNSDLKFFNPKNLSIITAVLLLAPSTFYLVRVHPFYLESFNMLAGGVSGGHKLGFETTYYLDTMTPKALKKINSLPKKARIGSINIPYRHLLFLKNHGLLRNDLNFASVDNADFWLLIPREGSFSESIWELYELGNPTHSISFDGVSLFMIYNANIKKPS